jgi:hypothetical protein
MIHRFRHHVLLLLILGSGTQVCLASAGESGMPVLKMGLPVRSTALADASVSWVRGASAAWYNPAGVRTEGGTVELMLVHREWIQDTRLEFLGASFPLGERDALAFSLATQTVPDIEIRTRPPTHTNSVRTSVWVPPPSSSTRRFSLTKPRASDSTPGSSGRPPFRRLRSGLPSATWAR